MNLAAPQGLESFCYDLRSWSSVCAAVPDVLFAIEFSSFLALSQSVSQSVSQSALSQSVIQSFSRSATQSFSTQSFSTRVSQSVSHSVGQSLSQSALSLSVSHSLSQSLFSQSVNPSVSQSLSHSVTQSLSHSVHIRSSTCSAVWLFLDYQQLFDSHKRAIWLPVAASSRPGQRLLRSRPTTCRSAASRLVDRRHMRLTTSHAPIEI